nr:MAG TPA: hypothetical protein [Caudoviricetes sp.]
MKVFKVYADQCGYDEYSSFVVAANSKEEIMEHLHVQDQTPSKGGREFRFKNETVDFRDDQFDIHIEEVDLNAEEPFIIDSSFNAG